MTLFRCSDGQCLAAISTCLASQCSRASRLILLPGRGQQRVEFLLVRNVNKPSVKALRRNREHLFDRRGVLG